MHFDFFSLPRITVLAFVCLLSFSTACAKTTIASTAAISSSAPSETVSPATTQPARKTIEIPDAVNKGEPFLISFHVPNLQKAFVTWNKKELTLLPGQDGQGKETCVALLSAELDTKKTQQSLTIIFVTDTGREKFEKSIQLLDKEYPVQRLQVAPKYVSPPASEQERIQQDRAAINSALAAVSQYKYWNIPFIRPVAGEVTSEFGLRREFNGQKRNPHKGLDLDGRTGDTILAAESGIVVLVRDTYYGGKTVILDHGLGVFTSYLHMSEFSVTKGQTVKQGDILGLVGSTGRVTGPHLHLSLFVLGQTVSPATILEPY